MSKFLFVIDAKMLVGFIVVRDRILERYPNADVSFDMATVEVVLYLDEWGMMPGGEEDYFTQLHLDGLIADWERHTYLEDGTKVE